MAIIRRVVERKVRDPLGTASDDAERSGFVRLRTDAPEQFTCRYK
jgi:hypothetical protein